MAKSNNKTVTASKVVGRPERLTLAESRDMIYEKFRTNLRILRGQTKISAVNLAKKIGIESGSRISALEYGRGNPTMEETILIAKYFNVTMDDLINKKAIITFQ
jgi:DNA-binding XRE family transcriptional regulator